MVKNHIWHIVCLIFVIILLNPSIITTNHGSTIEAVTVNELSIIPGDVKDVKYRESMVYFSMADGLAIYDIDDPENPSFTGSFFELGYLGHSIDLKNDFIITPDQGSAMHVIDVSNPSMPTLVNTSLSGNSIAVLVVDDIVYTTDNNDGLLIYDFSDPYVPVLLGQYPGSYAHVAVQDDIAVVMNFYLGFKILNISNPENIFEIYAFPDSTWTYSAVISANTIYTAGSYGLRIFDITDISSPSIVSTQSSGGSASYLQLEDDILYVSHQDRLVVYNVADPSTVSEIGEFEDIGGMLLGVEVIGDLILLASQTNGLHILRAEYIYESTNGQSSNDSTESSNSITTVSFVSALVFIVLVKIVRTDKMKDGFKKYKHN